MLFVCHDCCGNKLNFCANAAANNIASVMAPLTLSLMLPARLDFRELLLLHLPFPSSHLLARCGSGVCV